MMIHPHALSPAWSASMAGSPASDEGTIDGAYRSLLVGGLSSVEAGNIVAYIAGLHAVDGGWTVEGIKHLVAIRLLVADGVITS